MHDKTLEYEFSGDSFSGNIEAWQRIFSQFHPCKRILEIGSYEGRSAVWLIRNVLGPRGGGELCCIDPWAQEGEEDDSLWVQVEQRFDHNVSVASRDCPGIVVTKRKGMSIIELSALIASGHRESFDCVYIDGSHQAAEVLSDLLLAFELLRNGGLLICDDYLWRVDSNPLHSPKIAIDAFSNIYFDKLLQAADERPGQIYLFKQHGRSDREWNRDYISAVYASV